MDIIELGAIGSVGGAAIESPILARIARVRIGLQVRASLFFTRAFGWGGRSAFKRTRG